MELNDTLEERIEEKGRVDQLLAAWRDLRAHWQEEIDRAQKSFDFAAGRILTEKVKKLLNEEKRPKFEFNLVLQFVLFVAGKIKRDTRKFKAVPTTTGDEELAQVHTLLNQYSMQVTNGADELAKAATEAAICGRGYVSIYHSFQDNEEGDPCIQRIDPLLFLRDPDAHRIDQKDWRYCAYSPMLSADEIISLHKKYLSPEVIDEIKKKARELEDHYRNKTKPVSWWQRIGNVITGRANRKDDSDISLLNDIMDTKTGLYRTIEWHDKRTDELEFIYSPITRQAVEIPMDKLGDDLWIEQTMQSVPAAMRIPISVERIWMSVAVPALLPDRMIVEMPHPVQGSGYQFKEIKCYDFHLDETQLQGIVDALKAPTEFYNQLMMSGTQLMLDELNPTIDYPTGSIPVNELQNWKSKERGLLRGYIAQANGMKPEARKMDAGVFQMIRVLMEETADMQDNKFGMGLNARGLQESAGESGVLFNARTEQTEVMLSHLFDNLVRAQREIFRYTDRSNQMFMSLERMIRINQDDSDPVWLQINQRTLEGVKNDVTQGKFDFYPDIASLGETQRKEAVNTLGQAVQLFSYDPITQGMIGAEVLRNLDVPAGKKLADFVESRLGVAQMKEQQAALMEQQQFNQSAQQSEQQAAQDAQQGQLTAALQEKELLQPPESEGKK
jgi:hypothetical protein